MRVISSQRVADAVALLCVEASRNLPPDVLRAVLSRRAGESPAGKDAFRQLLDNAELSASLGLPLCQDCGLAVVFVRIGQEVRVEGGSLRDAVALGVVRGYREGFLRKAACDPLTRVGLGDNSPATVHFEVVEGDALELTLAIEDASADYSRAEVLPAGSGAAQVREYVVRRVADACRGVCAPVLVGVGLGGSFEQAALNSKRALLRPLDRPNPDPGLTELERDLEAAINRLGVGPLGLGGATTCLGVNALAAPCRQDSLPLGVSIQCHSARRASRSL